jgi:hypothetical protein
MACAGAFSPRTHREKMLWPPVSTNYGDINTSGLTYTIQGGANTIDIELK